MHEIGRNLRYAARGLRRSPVFALTVIATLALTIGANSAVFSVIDRVLLRGLPFPQAEQLVHVTHSDETALQIAIPPIRLLDWSERNSSFQAIATHFTGNVTDTTRGSPELVVRATVTPGFLRVWGLEPALGRTFVAEEHHFGGPASILISDRYWRERLNAKPDVVGETLIVEGRPVTVIGVMPPELALVDAQADLWAPLLIDAPFATSRQSGWFDGVVGRLRPNVSLDQAELDLRAVQAELAREHPETDSGLTISAVRYRDTVVGPHVGSMWLLFGAVSMLVLIACTNIAALLLARGAQRERDMAIRFALGASRTRIAGHVLIETALLVLTGTIGGLLLAHGAVSVLDAYTNDLPTFGGIEVDARVLTYTFGCAFLVVLLCGLLPASRSADGARSFSRGARSATSSRQRLSWALVGVQVALSVTLLIGAGLLLRSFDSLSRVDPGFESERVLSFIVHGSFRETNDPAGVLRRINRTIDELGSLPGVEAAATSSNMPGASFSNQEQYEPIDWAPSGGIAVLAESRAVSPGYFATLQIPLLSGELCRRPEAPTGAREAMVNQAFKERYFGTSRAVGRQLSGNSPSRIVGVVANAREIDMRREAVPTVYSCNSAPNPVPLFFVRTNADPMSIAEPVRAKLAEIEPLRAVYQVAPLSRHISDVHAQDRLRAALLALFAAAALSLACLGVHGTLSYVVSLSRREAGLRMALGALSHAIVTRYLIEALSVVGVACIVGLVLSLAFSRVLSGLLYGISPADPVTFASVVGIVLLVATVAGVVPAVRASRIHPMIALREE